MLDIIVVSSVLGMVSGVLAGLFGIGGGLVIVPVLAVLFKEQGFSANLIMIMSVATSLAVISFTAVSSVWAHHRLGSVIWSKVVRLIPGIIIGSALGAIVAKQISADALRIFLVVFLLYVGVQMALQISPKAGLVNQSKPLDFCVAIIIGLLSAIVGIGGGTLTVPYLVRGQMLMRNAVAVSSACGLPIAIAGASSYILLGLTVDNLPAGSFGYIYLPAFLATGLTSILTAPLGAKLAHRLPAQKLKRYFSLLLFVMAAKLTWF
ncbi:MAG: sulfite exporter TauE/SafE family protein [Methylococcales bacterium]|nr:sulfite exporter TauE/SafE family protein [Methylococcales bacterium]